MVFPPGNLFVLFPQLQDRSHDARMSSHPEDVGLLRAVGELLIHADDGLVAIQRDGFLDADAGWGANVHADNNRFTSRILDLDLIQD